MSEPHWLNDPRMDSQAAMAAYVEYMENCDDDKAEGLQTRWEEAQGPTPKRIRTMGCEVRDRPAHKDCGDPGCTTCNVGRRVETFQWASDAWIMAYEELRRPNSLDITDVLKFLKTK